MVGRPAWCLILSEKKVSTLSSIPLLIVPITLNVLTVMEAMHANATTGTKNLLMAIISVRKLTNAKMVFTTVTNGPSAPILPVRLNANAVLVLSVTVFSAHKSTNVKLDCMSVIQMQLVKIKISVTHALVTAVGYRATLNLLVLTKTNVMMVVLNVQTILHASITLVATIVNVIMVTKNRQTERTSAKILMSVISIQSKTFAVILMLSVPIPMDLIAVYV